jgi:hypothetical protein
LCLPIAICGPFCSVPPIGMMTVLVPDVMRSRSSVPGQVFDKDARWRGIAACCREYQQNSAKQQS